MVPLIQFLQRLFVGNHKKGAEALKNTALGARTCRFEQFETRRYMAADLHLGAVYFEDASGDDAQGDTIQVTYEGGAPGTQLTRIVIDGDKDGQGLSAGDLFFDTQAGGVGAFASVPLKVVSNDGFKILSVQVADGSPRIIFELEGFDAGEKLVFTVDTDEVQFVDPNTGEMDVNAFVEGGEFQRSHLIASFTAPHFEDITGRALFWDHYDDKFAAAEEQSGLHLNLPPDAYSPPQDFTDRTAGANTLLQQIPLPITISGIVFEDINLNNHQDQPDPGIGNVTLELLQFDGNQYVSTGKTTKTDSQGFYKFDGLLPGKYRVVETQPSGYFSVGATAGTVTGQTRGVVVSSDVLSEIELLGGEDSIRNDFAEAKPASISGHVQADLDGDCEIDPGEPPIEGVTIQLLDAQGNIVTTTLTNAQGDYSFVNLRPGIYTVHELQPAGYLDGDEHVGSAGGVNSSNDVLSDIRLNSGVNGVNYDFCEIPPASISGYVYVDTNNNGVFDSGESGIANAEVYLKDKDGQPTGARTRTNALGFYEFAAVVPGIYGVGEIQPAGYFDGLDSAGSAGGTAMNPGDMILGAVLTPGLNAVNYNFGELLPASISGNVLSDNDNDCVNGIGEKPIEGVIIRLLDAQGNVVRTTTTDAQGNYIFENLAPGTYSIREEQPAGYFDGDEHAGSAGGAVSNDLISQVALGSGVAAVDYDFCEMPPTSISGFVYSDLDNDGVFDQGEAGIPNVEVYLKDANGQPTGTRTRTDSNGFYKFDGLAPGTYGVGEVQPAGWLDGLDSAGSAGGAAMNPGDMIMGAVLTPGLDAVNYNFGELLPASIRGHVQIDTDGDCELDPGEQLLSGVVIHLLDAGGNTIATTTTDANGEFEFTGLMPGTYGLREEQPQAYFDSGEDVGSAGGAILDNDLMGQIQLGSGVHAVDYHFCENPAGSISGYVFQDGASIPTVNGERPDPYTTKDGVFTPDDKRIDGVVLELRNGVTGEPILGSVALPGHYNPNRPIRTVTDANGHYEFTGLPAGSYAVYEVQPDGYVDSVDTPGSLGGIAINPNKEISPLFLEALTVPPKNDAIIRISLFAGEKSVSNNFSEVKYSAPPTPYFFTVPPAPVAPIVVTPPVVTPPPFQPLIANVPIPFSPLPVYTGSSKVINYTWHLSIIDAGQPRGQGGADAVVKLAAVPGETVAWRKANLHESIWSLVKRTKPIEKAHQVLFGMHGAIPITGDFNGDGVTDLGVFKAGQWFIDLNGNGIWDEGDLWVKLGHEGDLPVTGDWDGDGKTDIGIYGPAWPRDPQAVLAEPGLPDPENRNTGKAKNIPPSSHEAALGTRALKLTAQGKLRADLIDHVFHYGTPTDIPVVGDWNGDGIDTIAVFHDGKWYLDVDGDGKFTDADKPVEFGAKGDKPVVGDFNGDGIDEIGIFRDGKWYIDTNRNGKLDADDQQFEMGRAGDIPVVGDWDGDGRDEPGVFNDSE